MTVIFGTVASANANSSFAPCLMIPPNSCCVPGRKPGTSSKVTSGRLNASQKRTNRAPFTEALMSSTPASTAGWLATMPTGPPSRRAKPTTMFFRSERVAEAHKPRSLHRGVDVEHARQHGWLVGHDAHRSAVQARKAHHNVLQI